MSKKNHHQQTQILEQPEKTSIISHYDCGFKKDSLDDSILNLSSEQLIKANFPQVNNDNQAIKTAITTQKTTKEQRAEEEKHFKSLIATSLQTLTARKKERAAKLAARKAQKANKLKKAKQAAPQAASETAKEEKEKTTTSGTRLKLNINPEAKRNIYQKIKDTKQQKFKKFGDEDLF